MAMRGWQAAAIRRVGVVALAVLVALAALPPMEPGTALAYAPASESRVTLASDLSQGLTAQASGPVGVSINDGAVSTQSLDVTLTMIPLPGAVRMQLSNSSDLAGGVWEPFATRRAWRLAQPGPSGAPVTVYVQFGNSNGDVSAIYRDEITVSQKTADQTAPAASVAPAATPASVALAAPNCSPRPRIDIRTERAIGIPEEGSALLVTISVTGANNTLREVRFDAFTNVQVAVDSPVRQVAPFIFTAPAGQQRTSLQFGMWKQTPGQAGMIRLTIVDGCGEWSTFVGGGANAF